MTATVLGALFLTPVGPAIIIMSLEILLDIYERITGK